MDERYLKARLAKELRAEFPRAVVYRHEDKFTAGIPDFSVTLGSVTVWLEVKWQRGQLTAAQNVACKRLGAFVVRYAEGSDGEKTTTVHRYEALVAHTVGRRFEHSAVIKLVDQALNAPTRTRLAASRKKGKKDGEG